MPPKLISDNDIERGKRLIKIYETRVIAGTWKSIGELLGGYPLTTVRGWSEGKPIPSTALKAFHAKGIDIIWLLTGEGEMMRQSSSAGSISPISLPADLSPGEIRTMAEKLLRLADKLEELN